MAERDCVPDADPRAFLLGELAERQAEAIAATAAGTWH
jgi:hypothetical protein